MIPLVFHVMPNGLNQMQRTNTPPPANIAKKTFSVATMGISAVDSHCNSSKHKQIEKDLSRSASLFERSVSATGEPDTSASATSDSAIPVTASEAPPSSSAPQPTSTVLNVTCQTPSRRQTPIDTELFKNVAEGEVVWCLRLVHQHQSYNSCSDLNETFKRIFIDSPIAFHFK